jgi:riboflavin kinase/FMN adenylyltransferase
MRYNVRDLARRAFLLDAGDEASPFSARSQLVRLGQERDFGCLGDAVCTIGAFDGVHRGHRFLFARTVADAKRRGMLSAIVTFDPDPDELFLPGSQVYKLLNNEDRLEYLRGFGADLVVSVPFTRDLAARTAASFMREVLRPVFVPRAVHVGADFKLGAGNAGNVAELRALGAVRGKESCEVFGYDLLCDDATPVSATRVRRMLMERGDCAGAADLLTRCHFVRGRVVQGRQKGREFGFPTANVELSYPYVVPAEGVYAGLVLVDGQAWGAAVNVGVPRTFASENNCGSIEAHLVGYEGDLYGAEVAVAFVERLRGQQTFESLDALMATVQGNIAWVREHLGERGVEL